MGSEARAADNYGDQANQRPSSHDKDFASQAAVVNHQRRYKHFDTKHHQADETGSQKPQRHPHSAD